MPRARCRSVAAYVGGLGFADHAFEHLDSEGDLTLVAGISAGAELGPDQVLMTADRGLGQVAPAVAGGMLPSPCGTAPS